MHKQTAGLCSTSLPMARDTRSRAEEDAAASAMARTRAPVRWEVAASSEELRPPPRVEYSLTPLGEKVLPIIDEIAKFGMENL